MSTARRRHSPAPQPPPIRSPFNPSDTAFACIYFAMLVDKPFLDNSVGVTARKLREQGTPAALGELEKLHRACYALVARTLKLPGARAVLRREGALHAEWLRAVGKCATSADHAAADKLWPPKPPTFEGLWAFANGVSSLSDVVRRFDPKNLARVEAAWPTLDDATRERLRPALDGFLLAQDLVETAKKMAADARAVAVKELHRQWGSKSADLRARGRAEWTGE